MIQDKIDKIKSINFKDPKVIVFALIFIAFLIFWFKGCGTQIDPIAPTPEVPELIDRDSLTQKADSIQTVIDSVDKTIDKTTLQDFIDKHATKN